MADIKSDIKQTGKRGVYKTRFEGMLLFDLNIFEDDRGVFTEVWQTEAQQELGLPDVVPKQLGVSRSKRGTIRAIHAEPYDKIVTPLTGRIFVAMVDLRTESPTFGQVESFELDNSQMLFIPSGVGNSFQVISDEDVLYTYCTAGIWSSEKAYSGGYIAINYKDPDLNIHWPIGDEEQIVSLKDKSNKSMRESFPEMYK